MPEDRRPSERSVEAVRSAFARRAATAAIRRRERYDDPAQIFFRQTRERDTLRLLRRAGIEVTDATVLDVGCGSGAWLRRLVSYGVPPQQLHGIDLLPDRVERARILCPGMDLREGNAERLPFGDASFDLVHQSTVFSSILDRDVRTKIAAEMWRVLRPTGTILWYDFWINPLNPDTIGMRRSEILRLFPSAHPTFRRTTLAPPVARLVVAVSPLAAALLDTIPLLRTHYLVLLRKPNA